MGLGLNPSPPGHRVLYSATEEKDKRKLNFGEIYINMPLGNTVTVRTMTFHMEPEQFSYAESYMISCYFRSINGMLGLRWSS